MKNVWYLFILIIIVVIALVCVFPFLIFSPTQTPQRLEQTFFITTTPIKTPEPTALSEQTLASAAKRHGINIGATLMECIQRASGTDEQCKELIKSEYSGMTSEVELDWVAVEATEGTTNFKVFDRYVSFANDTEIKLHFVHLLWPSQPKSYPPWVFPGQTTTSCGTRTPESLDSIMHKHITGMLQHNTGRVVAWNVVNEAFDGYGQMGQNCFYKIMGKNYIDKAFIYARQNTNGLLVLNDTFTSQVLNFPGNINRKKVDAVFAYVKDAKARGIPIDAVGVQNHLHSFDNYFGPEYEDGLNYIFRQAQDAGVKVMITEMDVYQGSRSQEDVKKVYKSTMVICLQNPNCISLNTWGISDANTWLRRKPGILDANPLLFDETYQKKPAYFGILEALQ